MTKVAKDGSDREGFNATLDTLAREGARKMIAAALDAEVAAYVDRFRGERGDDGRAAVVRNGHAKPRKVTIGSGTVTIEAPRVNDKREVDGERQKFRSTILPPYLRRSKNVSELLPVLYLRGLSTGDFREALPLLLGENASGLSPSAITRLVSVWAEEQAAWKKRSLADRDYVYVWVDGVHFNVRLEEERVAALVVMERALAASSNRGRTVRELRQLLRFAAVHFGDVVVANSSRAFFADQRRQRAAVVDLAKAYAFIGSRQPMSQVVAAPRISGSVRSH